MRFDRISAFGEDARGEMYICDQFDGEVYKIRPTPCATVLGDLDGDGVVAGTDINGYVEAFVVVGFHVCADMASPFGVLDGADTAAFVSALLE